MGVLFIALPIPIIYTAYLIFQVGYGDISPVTPFGKLIGSCCAICGVLVIALPIPIIGNNFAAFYKNERRREQLKEKKAALERARRKGAITPFPGQNGFAIEGALAEVDGYEGDGNSVNEERRSSNLNASSR